MMCVLGIVRLIVLFQLQTKQALTSIWRIQIQTRTTKQQLFVH